jgi:transcriptional regulator with XRE-family HTH domain
MITGEQVKAARELLGWTREHLANEAQVTITAVGVCERGDQRQSEDIVDAIQDALEKAGVKFLEGEPPQLRPGPVGRATFDPPPER